VPYLSTSTARLRYEEAQFFHSSLTSCVSGMSWFAGAEPPQIKAQYSSTLVVQVGATVRISCPVHADPRPLVTWTKDSERLHAGWQRFRVQRAGTWLHVSDVQTTDAGRYTCEATNGFGTATVTINLRVVRKSILLQFRLSTNDSRNWYNMLFVLDILRTDTSVGMSRLYSFILATAEVPSANL